MEQSFRQEGHDIIVLEKDQAEAKGLVFRVNKIRLGVSGNRLRKAWTNGNI